MRQTPLFDLARDAFGRLVLTDAQGQTHVGVTAVRAFPISAPDEGLSLVDGDGHELAWVPKLSGLPQPLRDLVTEAVTQREFMPVIRQLIDVSSFATPSTWHVMTDRGETEFVLKGEEDIRRLAPGVLIVSDAHGVQFLIRDLNDMDAQSRRLMDRFL